MALDILVIEFQGFKIFHCHCSILSIEVFLKYLKQYLLVIMKDLGLKWLVQKDRFLDLIIRWGPRILFLRPAGIV